ncbi:MAG: UvrB/UvrC motif-containing protein [Verrucomicrobia bacterium]|nr:UvrB/UvrC motif-containing protein [Verrucomicrobiota bacterium]MCF7709141.1 UvrB/UvrC motif-containing protein [Verrucomicrobiota bacterium]
MLCENCKKKEATVHLTQIIEGKMHTIDLCEECSKSKGIDDPMGYSLAGLLAGMGASKETKENQPDEKIPAIECPECGLTTTDFKKTGRLGCPKCYTTFAEPLRALLKSMHKSLEHKGKIPKHFNASRSVSEKVQQLQVLLDKAVQAEEYEEAARLRDQIREIKKEPARKSKRKAK